MFRLFNTFARTRDTFRRRECEISTKYIFGRVIARNSLLIKTHFSRISCSVFARHHLGQFDETFIRRERFSQRARGPRRPAGETGYSNAASQKLQLDRNNVGTQINPKSPTSAASCSILHARCHAHVRIRIAAKFEARYGNLATRATFRSVPALNGIRGFQYCWRN